MIYLLGGGFQTGAQNLNYLWAGRWLAGLGVGFLVMIVPVYQYVYPEQIFLFYFEIRSTIVPNIPEAELEMQDLFSGWLSFNNYI
jgi:hypothetical protein